VNPTSFGGPMPRSSFEAGIGIFGEIGKEVLLATLKTCGAYSEDSDYLDSKILANNLEELLGQTGARLIMTQSYIRSDIKHSGTAAN